jgi:glyoxylase-like metal-dependent hydrolase (beta-lactamase superfamily II)
VRNLDDPYSLANARGEIAESLMAYASETLDEDRVCGPLPAGHTPDSICLLERASGLLFTGDTYYSGEIYLWAPETNVADYTASISNLVRFEQDLKMLLSAHGPPVAEPRRLLELQKALQDIQAGTIRFETTTENRRLFRFDHFSILMDGSASRD